jgi:hypothetical protein
MYAAAAAGTTHTATDGSNFAASTSSQRKIAAVQAVETLEADSSLAVDSSFIEGDLQDLPGSATASSTTLQLSNRVQQVLASPLFAIHVSDIVQHSFRADNMPIIGVIWHELTPTATAVESVETSVCDTSATLQSLVTTVSNLAQSVDALQQSMSTTQTTVVNMNLTLDNMVRNTVTAHAPVHLSPTEGATSNDESGDDMGGLPDERTGDRRPPLALHPILPRPRVLLMGFWTLGGYRRG